MFFQDWTRIINTIILSILTYGSMIIILRISGKRTLSSFNAFDFLITVTIGSISATVILSTDTKFLEGIFAIITLVILQYLVAKLTVHWRFFNRMIKSDPTLIFYEGEFLKNQLLKMRVTKDDVLQEIRITSGVTIDQVHAVILKANDKISVITSGSQENIKALK